MGTTEKIITLSELMESWSTSERRLRWQDIFLCATEGHFSIWVTQRLVFEEEHIRYVALYANGILTSKARIDLEEASSQESDKYEELLVNPTLLLLTKQRGEIDCGGFRFILVRYGNFFQFVKGISDGHVSVCIEPTADPLAISQKIDALLAGKMK